MKSAGSGPQDPTRWGLPSLRTTDGGRPTNDEGSMLLAVGEAI